MSTREEDQIEHVQQIESGPATEVRFGNEDIFIRTIIKEDPIWMTSNRYPVGPQESQALEELYQEQVE